MNKFHTASEPVQALWLILTTAMVLGTVWCVTAMVTALARRRDTPPGQLLYGVYEDAEGRPHVHLSGRAQAALPSPTGPAEEIAPLPKALTKS